MVLGSSPLGGKGAEGASTGLDWPRAGLERRLSAATQSDAALLFWLPRGNRPLSRLGRGGTHGQRRHRPGPRRDPTSAVVQAQTARS